MVTGKKGVQLERNFCGIVFKFARLAMSPEDKFYAPLLNTHSHGNQIIRDQAKECLHRKKRDLVLALMPLAIDHGALALGFIGTTLGLLVPLIMKIFVGTPRRFIAGLLS